MGWLGDMAPPSACAASAAACAHSVEAQSEACSVTPKRLAWPDVDHSSPTTRISGSLTNSGSSIHATVSWSVIAR